MMTHLTPADYTAMPWANGRGQTIEMLRMNDALGRMQYRLSMATVSENGPFSIFEGMNRNLTVIEGPGFDLIGERKLRADPLIPIEFPGDIRIVAADVREPSVDFNVIAARGYRVTVSIQRGGILRGYAGELLCYFALGPAQIGRWSLGKHDLLYGRPKQAFSGGPVILVQID